MMLLLGAMIGAALGMIITAVICIDEFTKERNGKRLVNYDSMMDQIGEYWEDCKRDCEGVSRCELCNKLCFESIIRIIDDEVE